MRKLHILVEGQTEEVIVNNVIGPYLSSEDLYVTTSILKTKPSAGGNPAHVGGVSSWAKILREIRLLLGDTSTTMLTTLIDYYGFPDDAPGMADRPVQHQVREKASAVYRRPLVVADIGLDEIRRQCPHADRWLSAIETALKP